jgi:hypothetical protein
VRRTRAASMRKLTESQKRYAAVGKLIRGAQEILLRSRGRPSSLADLHQDLKFLAAARGLRYDSAMVCTAADIALRRLKSDDGSALASVVRQ